MARWTIDCLGDKVIFFGETPETLAAGRNGAPQKHTKRRIGDNRPKRYIGISEAVKVNR
jgi:hypothetical protein